MADETIPADGEETPTEHAAESATDEGSEALGDAGKQALDRMKAERNEAKKQAKALERELEEVRKATMTETERATVEAEQRGRQAAATEFGTRLARTEFDALAGRRNPSFDTAGALEFVDLSRFVGEDGEPDKKAIQAAVERLVPAPVDGPPSFDGGARTSAPAPVGMDALIRKAAGRA